MQKEEILLNESEIVETKPNKLKIVLPIIASTLVIATITTLLIGHLKFNWFKSDEYKIDAKIQRNIYQANYFSEVKTINTKFSFKDDHIEERKYVIDNNFVVFLTDKKDNINTGALALLSATVTVNDQVKELAHLDMLDEAQRKEIEANPDGAKYPMVIFTFTDDGKIQKINLPNNMDEYNAESIIELINKVIPKLTRNKKEDLSKGLEITTKKTKNKRTIVQREAPKEIQEFKGSRYAKVVNTEIEDDQITKVESDGYLYMESKPEGEELTYGPKEFFYNDKSEITLNEVRYNEKENVELFNKLAEKFILIESEVLLKSFKKSNEEEEEKEDKEKTKQARNLFEFNTFRSIPLKTFDVLGQKVSVKYEVGISNFKAYNKIVISSGRGKFEFGMTTKSDNDKDKKNIGNLYFHFVPPHSH